MTLIQDTARKFREADACLIITGAGMGVPSGFSTFRGSNGMWPKIEEVVQKPYMEWATPYAFVEDPELAWGFYGARLRAYADTPPHEGYHILERLTQDKELFVFTTNVDGHAPQVFGDRVVEKHGSLLWGQQGYYREGPLTNITDFDFQFSGIRATRYPLDEQDEALRPNVLLFNDYHWNRSRYQEQNAAYVEWQDYVFNFCDHLLVVEIGCGNVISTGRFEAYMSNKLCDEFTHIRINPDNDPARNLLWIREDALEALQKIEVAYKSIDSTCL